MSDGGAQEPRFLSRLIVLQDGIGLGVRDGCLSFTEVTRQIHGSTWEARGGTGTPCSGTCWRPQSPQGYSRVVLNSNQLRGFIGSRSPASSALLMVIQRDTVNSSPSLLPSNAQSHAVLLKWLNMDIHALVISGVYSNGKS